MMLRIRLALVVAVTFAIVVVGCVYAAHVSARNQLAAQTDHFLLQRAQEPAFTHGESKAAPPPGFGPGGNNETQFAKPDAVTQLIESNGTTHQTFEGQPALPVNEVDKQIAAHGGGPQLRYATVDGTPYRLLTVALPNGGAAQIGRSVADSNNVLATLDVRLLLIALAGTLVAAALAWLIARRFVRPVEQLTDAAEQVAQTQDLAHHIDVGRRDEIGRLADSFNTMLAALETSREQQRRLVIDASHELRTPLTALRTNVELLQRAPDLDDAQRAELVGATQVELAELGDLVAELVELATDARAEEPVTPVDLGELTARVVDRYRRRTGRVITLALTDPAVCSLRAAAIERAVSNLVDNAVKFSPPATSVEVAVVGHTIEIRDRGEGIDTADREHVFDRFYRAPTARTQPGSGLGLAIVRQIAELHGGTCSIESRPGGGSIARLVLPAVEH